MTRWVAFALVVNAVLVVVLALARATQAASSDGQPRTDAAPPDQRPRSNGRDDTEPDAPPEPIDGNGEPADGDDGPADDADEPPDDADVAADDIDEPADDAAATVSTERTDGSPAAASAERRAARDEVDIRSFSTGALLANVAVTHGTLGAILLVAAWAAGVPATALGIDATANVGARALGIGVALGLVLYAVNELIAANLDSVGVEYSDDLRGALGPDSIAGWLVLLGVVLPIIAVFEELLFRAALIGAMSVGFGVSPWLMAAASSLAFGVGHGLQGPGGMIVTGLLGFVLAAAYVWTGSLLAVVVAHYLINALEFAVHEGLGLEWAG